VNHVLRLLAVLALTAPFAAPSVAQTNAAGTSQPATAPATQPTSAPLPRAGDGTPLLATFDDTEITEGQIDRLLGLSGDEGTPNVPEEQLQQLRQSALHRLILRKLYESYAADQPGFVTQEEVDAIRKERTEQLEKRGHTLEEAMKARHLTEEDVDAIFLAEAVDQKLRTAAASDEKVTQYYENHQDEFDGTKVLAKHILLRVDKLLSTPAEREAAKEKLEQIKADVQAGKITFDDAIRQYSDDPGAARGVSLPAFTRHGRMVEPFAAAAFALKNEGDISDPVKTAYGYHIIQLVGRENGEPQAIDSPMTKRTITNALLQTARETLIDDQLAAHHVTVYLEYVKPPKRPAIRRPVNVQRRTSPPPRRTPGTRPPPPMPPGGPSAPPSP
jgi:parvulin-like peptidyl-prolyl isomerase